MKAPYDVSGHVPSRQSQAVNVVMRSTFKQVSRVLPTPAPAVRVARTAIERACVLAGFDKVPHTHVREHTDNGQVRGEWVGPEARPGDQVLLYTHGSAYAVCSPRTHRGFVAAFARRTDRRAFSLDYRLGPEHRFPAAHDDIVRAYLWLLSRGHRPEDIVVAGDSAGGHLSLSLCGELRRIGVGMPAGLVLISPLVDGSFDTAAAAYGPSNDATTVPRFARRLIGHYFRGADRDDPRFDVSLEAGPDLPPTLVIAGGGEMMRGDSELWGEVQTAAGGHCELQVWPGQVHVFPIFGLVPEARLAFREMVRFVEELDGAALSDVG
ncbi:alpha/beta hydrolase [Nocardioides humilatus]|uniref:Alpha/beta hydrolase n=1 Tax=Nocardioides humilatus TaxID=2607660 RepID=A0A5B1LHM2_9ACTN|nr:alpha/beta hydrolase [Nocardioides humilatus]KAA1419300.1 alpha/beta hydrolase [Nocardioides humilatus]